jgi:hypothetical protein
LVQERTGLETIKTANDAKRNEKKNLFERHHLQAETVYKDQIKANQALRDSLPQLEKANLSDFEEIRKKDFEIEKLQTQLIELRSARDAVKARAGTRGLEIVNLRKTIDELVEPDFDEILKTTLAVSNTFTELALEVEALQDPDFTDVDARIAAVDETNEIAGHCEQLLKQLDELGLAKRNADDLTEKLNAIKDYKGKLILEAGLPVDGLGFDSGEVTYKGLPLSQASGAEQLEISCAIAMAGHPEIGILTIDVGWAELDSGSRQVLIDWAKKTHTQIWPIKVTDEPGEEGFYIEDGEVRAIDGKPVVQTEEAPKAASLPTALAQAQADNPPEFPAVQDPIPF